MNMTVISAHELVDKQADLADDVALLDQRSSEGARAQEELATSTSLPIQVTNPHVYISSHKLSVNELSPERCQRSVANAAWSSARTGLSSAVR